MTIVSEIVDLALTDEQPALIGSFGRLLAEQSTPERVRAGELGGFDRSLWATPAVEAPAQSVNVQTSDLREALTAYAERRPPTFEGR